MRTGIEKLLNDNKLTPEEALVKGRDAVSDALTYLMSSKVRNFYARVIGLMDKVAAPGFGTMAVSAHAGRYVFIYDPLFAATRSYEEVCATCEHEVLHLILEHIPRMQTLLRICTEEEDLHLMQITANLAMDMAANEFLARSWPGVKDYENKPLGYWVTADSFDPPLPKDMSYEEYQELLIDLLLRRLSGSPTKLYRLAKKLLEKSFEAAQNAHKQQNKNSSDSEEGDGAGEGEGSGEGEGEAGPPDERTPDELKQEIENLDPVDQKVLEMLLNAMKPHTAWGGKDASISDGDSHKLIENGKELIRSSLADGEKSRGTIPGHIMELIRKMLMPPTVPWTQFLHNIVQRTKQTKKERGMCKPSKKLSALKMFARKKEEEGDERFARLPHLRRMVVFPGVKHNNKYTIYYVVDTSGSMATSELQMGLSELQHIQKADSDVSICVIYADTDVCKEYWIGPSSAIDRELTGRGGTNFELVFQHIKQRCGKQDKAPDIVIYCTDGYAPPPHTRLPVPTVWLLTATGMPVMKESGHINIQMKDYQLEDASV